MLEIDAYIVNKIKTDATMISLMNITSSDARVYSWYPKHDVVYTIGVTEVSIIYRGSYDGRPYRWSYPSQKPNMSYLFRVLSINKLKLGQVSERLVALFDKTSIETDNWYVKWIEVSGNRPGMTEGSPTMPIESRNVTFSFAVTLEKM